LREQLLAAPAVELHADVPELEPYLSRASVAVNPAVSGSGVNIKIIDYLQAGVPVVSTSLASRGLPLESGVHLEVRDDPAEFAAALSLLLADPVRAEALSVRGRDRIHELLDPQRNIARIARLLGEEAVTA
jgi:glycosyltransferase involved in cell wall biosynthesis